MQSNNGTVVTKVTKKGDLHSQLRLLRPPNTHPDKAAMEPRDASIIRSSTIWETFSVSCWRSNP